LGATAHSSEPNVNRDRQSMKTDFLPNTSLAFPASGIPAVATNWYILRTHPAKINEALNDDIMVGKATAIAVPLIADSNNAILAVAKTRYLDILEMIQLALIIQVVFCWC